MAKLESQRMSCEIIWNSLAGLNGLILSNDATTKVIQVIVIKLSPLKLRRYLV